MHPEQLREDEPDKPVNFRHYLKRQHARLTRIHATYLQRRGGAGMAADIDTILRGIERTIARLDAD